MKKFLLVPVLGVVGLAAVSVGYAMVGVLLAMILLTILAIPFAVAFRRFAPLRHARMHDGRPTW